MTEREEKQVRRDAVVDICEGEYLAVYGDFEGYGSTEEEAIENLILDIEYREAENRGDEE